MTNQEYFLTQKIKLQIALEEHKETEISKVLEEAIVEIEEKLNRTLEKTFFNCAQELQYLKYILDTLIKSLEENDNS